MQRCFVLHLRCENQLHRVIKECASDLVVSLLACDVDRGFVTGEVGQRLTAGSGEEALDYLQSLF